MTAASLANGLIERGLESAERAPKQQLFERLLGAFHSLGSGSPQHVWWVPGRLEVFGKHTDYAGGRTLVAALPRGFAVAARARVDGTVRAIDGASGEDVTLLQSDTSRDLTGWRRYAEVVVRRLARNFPQRRVGADIAFASDLPPAAGMSSSSVLMVSMAAALVEVGSLESSAEWRRNIHGPLEAAGYYGCVENGSRFGTLEGDAGVGTHGGSEDHAAILTARVKHLTGLAFVPMREIGQVRVPDEWRFIIAPSGVAAEKTGSVRDAYNQLSNRARLLLALWNASEPPAGSLGSALASGQDAADRLRALVRSSNTTGSPFDALERRLDHFVREDARVENALAAFGAADRAALDRLSRESQQDAETLLGNQIPETSALAASARSAGAFASCSFGAGFGGSVWALADRERAARVAQTWHPDAFVATAGLPLTKLDT